MKLKSIKTILNYTILASVSILIFSCQSESCQIIQLKEFSLCKASDVELNASIKMLERLDSLFLEENFNKINCTEFNISFEDNRYILEFLEKDKDTIRHYLIVKYQEIVHEVSEIFNNSRVDIHLKKDTVYKIIPYNEELIYARITEYDDGTRLIVHNPISLKTGHKVMESLSDIYGYIKADNDTVTIDLLLDKMGFVVKFPFSTTAKIDLGDEKWIYATANQISKNVFQGKNTFIQLVDSSGVILKNYKNNDVVYIKDDNSN